MRGGFAFRSSRAVGAIVVALVITVWLPVVAVAQTTTFIPSNIPTLLCSAYHDFKTIAGPLGLAAIAFTFIMGIWSHDPHMMRHLVRAVGFALGVYALATILGAAGLNTYCT